MRVKFVIALSLVLIFGTLGCAGEPAPSVSETPSASTPATSLRFNLADFPKLDGSTATIPLCSLLMQRLVGVSETEADAACVFSTTPTAYRNLSSGYGEGQVINEETGNPLPASGPTLLLAYEPDEVTKDQMTINETELEYHPIGRDGLVFIANSSNLVSGLTTEEIRAIYTAGITNWKQLGGNDQEIIAFQRPEESGSQALFRKLVTGDIELAKAPTTLVADSMGSLIDSVASYQNTGNALGYSVFYYVTRMLSVPELKILAVDEVTPSRETIASGAYPFVNDFYAVIRKDEPAGSPTRQLLEWLKSPEGAQLILEAGYVGLG
ncbi:MAG: substrate-binding domain-containing protein [Propionibacteriaceae bacterium]|nr:substrate-binding domain-containing protein [Propionibacteriaceae bacterium]